jgi:hypothetical protein
MPSLPYRAVQPLPARIALILWLGTSSRGIAEKAITAKVLQLGVPVVTAFHVTRLTAALLLAEPMYRWFYQVDETPTLFNEKKSRNERLWLRKGSSTSMGPGTGSAGPECGRPLGGRELREANDRGALCLMQRNRGIGEAAVAFQRVLDFFLGGGILCPGTQALLEHFGPRTIQVNLFARALVHNFKAVASQLRHGRGRCCLFRGIGVNLEHGKRVRVVKHVHGVNPFSSDSNDEAKFKRKAFRRAIAR